MFLLSQLYIRNSVKFTMWSILYKKYKLKSLYVDVVFSRN